MSRTLLAQLREAALAGALPQAARGLEDLDRRWPDPDVAALRAWVALAQDDVDAARRWIDITFVRAPDHREALTLAVELARRSGRDDEALRHARRFVALEPGSAVAHYNLGALLESGAPDEARAAYDAALAADSGFPAALRSRGWLRFRAGDPGARSDFEALARAEPRDPAAWLGRGACALRAGAPAAALDAFDRAQALAPGDAIAAHGRAEALERLDRVAESMAERRRAVALAGGDPGARCHLAMALSRAGEADSARAEAAAAARAAGPPLARWLAFQLLPIVYRDAADVAHWRTHWRAGLAAFDAGARSIDPDAASAVLTALPSFYRHYLDDELLADQRAAAAVVECLAATALRAPRVRLRARQGARLRIGVASAHFHRHTVGRLFGGLVRGLDRGCFEVVAFHLGSGEAARATAGTIADAVVGPLHALPAWVDAIEAADLDALLWLDIGMDGTTQALSALRFARLQAVLWGHPVTTGLSTIDVFLGAAGMAPADPAARYSERFVALPGIGLSLERPLMPTAAPRSGPARLVCAQGIHKLLPDHDAVFARILAAAPAATLAFAPGAAEPLRARLRARMRPLFDAHGVDFEHRVTVHPVLSDGDFRALLAGADLVLDSFGWSGGWTSLQALAAGVPVLTCPGAGLRARHTRAFLATLGLDDALVVSGADACVERASALAVDAADRSALAARVRGRGGALFDDPAPAAALSQWLVGELGR